MNTFLRSFTLALTLAAASLLGAVPAAHAQSGTPQNPYVITAVPYTITRAGYYILGNNVSSAQTSSNLIEVAASNVTLDLISFYISGPVGNTSQTTKGIYANERNNVTVKNGTVANVQTGIDLESISSSTTNNLNHELDGLRISRCNVFGVRLYYAASCSVTNCKLSFIGAAGGTGACAVLIYGPGVTVQGCALSKDLGSYGNAINADPSDFSRQNTISVYYYGVYGGTYQDNLTSGCAVPFDNGTDAGGNK